MGQSSPRKPQWVNKNSEMDFLMGTRINNNPAKGQGLKAIEPVAKKGESKLHFEELHELQAIKARFEFMASHPYSYSQHRWRPDTVPVKKKFRCLNPAHVAASLARKVKLLLF